jgi:hypothetical protein
MFDLKKFDISQIKSNGSLIVIGKRNTGKSFLVSDILYNHRDIPFGTIISDTESSTKFYEDIVHVHNEFSGQIIENVVKRQKLVLKHGKYDPRAFLVLDNCLLEQSWTKDQNIRFIFLNGRQIKILFIVAIPYTSIPPLLRTNVDFVFILREDLVNNRKMLYEKFAGMIPSFEMFCELMDRYTTNYDCLVINNTSHSNKLQDLMFWYKAESHNSFKMEAL